MPVVKTPKKVPRKSPVAKRTVSKALPRESRSRVSQRTSKKSVEEVWDHRSPEKWPERARRPSVLIVVDMSYPHWASKLDLGEEVEVPKSQGSFEQFVGLVPGDYDPMDLQRETRRARK